MAESPIDLLTIDLLCRVICQGYMMVLANRGLLMVLQPFVGQADSESCTHYLYLDLVSSVGVCVPVAVGPSVCRPFVCSNNGTMEGLPSQCNRTINCIVLLLNCIAGGECFMCGW